MVKRKATKRKMAKKRVVKRKAVKKKATKKKAVKKKATKKKAAKKTKRRVQKFKCPHCRKTIAVIDLESIKDTQQLMSFSFSNAVGDHSGPLARLQ